MDENTNMVSISKEEYKYLLKRDDKLQALENGGVDNWEWYSDSLADFYKEYPED